VPVKPPGLDVTVYPVIADPPVALAVNGTDALVADGELAVPTVGACGTVVAVIELDAAEAELVPIAEVAVTVKVYAVLDCKPVTVKGELESDAVKLPGDDVTVYEVIGSLLVGAVKVPLRRWNCAKDR
jgi:hypothetical protein